MQRARSSRPDDVAAIRGRLRGTSRFVGSCATADLVVEAVFEDLAVKQERLSHASTRSAARRDPRDEHVVVLRHAIWPPRRRDPERVVGLHYFYHPAKNRLVEVVAGKTTDPAAYRRAWRLQEALGKTPIASSDSSGFIVNRFFVPWLNEAVRMLEEGFASTADDRGRPPRRRSGSAWGRSS